LGWYRFTYSKITQTAIEVHVDRRAGSGRSSLLEKS
jgi:hypothetical protein